MKPDGVNMETTEPTEAATVAEHSPLLEQAPLQPGEASNDAAPGPAQKANDKPVATDTKAKPRAAAAKIQPASKTAGASRLVTSQRTVKNVTSSNSVSAAAAKKTTTTTAAKASAAGTVSKKPVGAAAASSTGRNQTRVADRKPVGVARTTTMTTAAAASVTNGTKPTSANGIPKRRPVAETVRPKTTATSSRPVASTAPKPSTSAITKPAAAGAISKTTRPATAPPASRPAVTTARATTSTPSKPPTTTAAKTAASRTTTAPSTGRTTAAQTSKTAAAKKDVPRPLPAAATKKPSTTTTSSFTKKNESSKPTAALKQNSVTKLSTTSKAADPKVAQTKTQPPVKSAPTKKPLPVHLPATNKAPIGRTPPASPATKPVNSSTHQSKRITKPTQAVPPFTAAKKTGVSDASTPVIETQGAAGAAVAAVAAASAAVASATAATVIAEPQTEIAASLPQGSSLPASEPEEVPLPVLAQETTPEVTPETLQSHVASPAQIIDTTQTSLPQVQPESSAPLLKAQEHITAPAEPEVPPVASSDLPKEAANQFTDQIPSISKAPPAAASPISQIISHTNLNEEEDEEEREGSQLVSVSEMSGTTQPTEESRPGSAGLVGGSAWRASGALLSELDSEEVSGSQQGASELSAPGVLEGTESMDDLGDGSLKGAIDMEGASAGSPDFEKVPDIPVNDFDEDEEDDDDDDRVCDMDVGSERADEPHRQRHDNDVDDDEDDEDVEMASEGVTESGLESYGNADEDDFAEDERLDNLNRVAQPPPPPPLLPAAPAAQWDQQNPFADPWAEPLFPQQVLENLPEPLHGAASAASPHADPWQADSETPTQTPAQAWLELGSISLVPENQEVPNQPSVQDEPQNLEAVMYLAQSHSTMQTLAPAPPSAPGMSLSSTLSSETSTPEELGDLVKLQPQDAQPAELFPQPDQDLGIHLEKEDQEGDEEAEAETLPADEVLGGPATAPTSNPSSSSVTEDEASDTEGEAQLEDSLESQTVSNVTFDSQATARRCLSTVEENEEAEMSAITPPSATSLASYGFDTMTTASNSNAQSTGESCIKSPGIFSLEELPEEAKESFVIPPPHTEPSLTPEQQYIECGKLESAEQFREEVEAPDPSASPITLQQPEENQDDIQPPYYSAICEKTENSYAGFTALPHPHRRDHAAYPRTYCDIIKPLTAAVAAPKLTCADLPPRNPGQQALSPQLRRLEQHQRQLLEMQQRREQQSKPLEEAEQERKRREEEEQRKKKDEAEEEIKRNKEEMERKRKEQEEEEEKLRKEEELKQRKDLELQLQQQQEELKQRQQIMQWQQELQQSNKGQTVLLSPSSGLCTIYEALENSDEEEGEEDGINELNTPKKKKQNKEEKLKKVKDADCERVTSDVDSSTPSEVIPLRPPHLDSPQTPSIQENESPPFSPPESPERPPPLELDWGKKVDIVQQLINQTLMLNRDGCSSLLLLPGGAGGTLSPLESSLWPSLLPPLTPPSATVTSVSSFSPEATGSSPQGEWTVVELETHH